MPLLLGKLADRVVLVRAALKVSLELSELCSCCAHVSPNSDLYELVDKYGE